MDILVVYSCLLSISLRNSKYFFHVPLLPIVAGRLPQTPPVTYSAAGCMYHTIISRRLFTSKRRIGRFMDPLVVYLCVLSTSLHSSKCFHVPATSKLCITFVPVPVPIPPPVQSPDRVASQVRE